MQISKMKRKIFIFFGVLMIILGLTYLMRISILESFAKFLIVEDEFDKVEYAFVLSGNAYDRGIKAAELYHEGKVQTLVCTGANQSGDMKSLGVDTLESDLTELQLLKNGVPRKDIMKYAIGTSTKEEADFIMEFCIKFDLDEIVIVSSKFHTRRVYQVFDKAFAAKGVEVFIAGASSSGFKELEWWKSEYGLIAVNNEYLKQLYYLIHY